MEFQDQIQRLIELSKETVLFLKKKINTTTSAKIYEKAIYYIYVNQENIVCLSEIVKDPESLEENYSESELIEFFEKIKDDIKSGRLIV